MARTDTLVHYLTDVAQAIKNKKIDQTPIQASSFDTEIANLPSDDISEYFTETIKGGSSSIGSSNWSATIKKLPAFSLTGTNCSNVFYGFKGNSIDLSLLNTQNVTTMQYMFYNCSNLTSLDLSNLNTSSVTTMQSMFTSCSKLTSLDLSNLNTSSVTTMQSMFSSCSNLTSLDLSNLNTSSVTNMASMFSSCSKLTSLNLSNFITTNVTNMQSMFTSCVYLTSLNLSNFNTLNVTNMASMFNACKNLTSLDLSNFITTNVTNMSSMFIGCSKLEDLDIRNFDFEKITGASSTYTINSMFSSCSNLTNLIFGINLGKGFTASAHNSNCKLNLSASTLLTHDSLMSVINNLYDISDKNTQDLQLGATNLAKLSSSEIAIATAKNWTVS